jgi:hypothetical protein
MSTQAVAGGNEGGRLAWYQALTGTERHAFWACFAGWGLDGMDVFLYTYMIPTLISLWGMSRVQAGSIVTVSLLTSSLGGWIAGVLADRFGRARLLQITVLWYSGFSLLSAFADNYSQLLVFRALHGLGFGGEWAVGATLMGEIIRAKYRATATGTVHSAWALGAGQRLLPMREHSHCSPLNGPGARCSCLERYPHCWSSTSEGVFPNPWSSSAVSGRE